MPKANWSLSKKTCAYIVFCTSYWPEAEGFEGGFMIKSESLKCLLLILSTMTESFGFIVKASFGFFREIKRWNEQNIFFAVPKYRCRLFEVRSLRACIVRLDTFCSTILFVFYFTRLLLCTAKWLWQLMISL